jgi:hypothetical protein
MLSKSTIALATALTFTLASAALAARSGGTTRGYSELGNGARTGGTNPAVHKSLGAPKAPVIMSDGKCWMTDRKTGGYGWTDCH